MGTFRGHNFGERPNGSQYPLHQRTQAAETRHVPGGNVNVIQDGGRQADTLSIDAYCTTSELATLLSDVGSTGTLVYSYESRSAYLQAVENAQEIRALGKFFCTLKLIGR